MIFFSLRRSVVAFCLLLGSAVHAQTAWLANSRVGGEARFLYANQIRRYDLPTKSWLAPVTLPRSGATAMAADATGAVVAYGTSIYKYNTAFAGEVLLGSVTSSVLSVFTDGNLVVAVHSAGLYGRVTIFDRTTGAKLSTVETYVDSMYGASHSPGNNRLYGRTSGISPADIVTSSYTDAGVAGSIGDSPYHGSYPSATRTWVFPDESRVTDSSGTVYTAPGLSYFGSFAGTVTDVAFNGDVPVVLRGAELISYTPNLLEAGRAALGVTTGAALQVTASEAFVFSPGVTDPAVKVVPLSAINAPEPGTPVDPNGLAYTVDDAFPDEDGNVLLFAKSQRSLFRWSPASRKYTGSYALLGVPKFAAYSKENSSAYFAYDTQQVRKMDLAAAKPKEVSFFNLPTTPNGLATAGQFIFASDSSGAWDTHYIYTPAGTLTHSLDWNYYSRVWQWDPVKRRMYFFRDDTSPNDLQYETIDAAGKITGAGETPYHGDFTVTPPIRVSPDGAQVVIGSGVVFETGTLKQVANLANTFVDGLWSGGKFVTLRAIGGVTQLQTWEGANFLPGATVRQFSGTPVRMFETPQGLLVITAVDGAPRFALLDGAFDPVYISPTKPVAPGSLAVTARSETSISLQWQDNATNETGFRIFRATTAGGIAAQFSIAADATSYTLGGLAAGTTYYFTIQAVNGAIDGDLSAQISAKTLSSNSVPTSPGQLIASEVLTDSVKLTWTDQSTNEETFQLERSTSPATTWMSLGGTGFNKTTYTDKTVTANTAYTYRLKAVNAAGSSGYATLTVTTPKLGGDFAGLSIRAGDREYFAFTGPARIERYDLKLRAWLDPVPLQSGATALWADEAGLYVAEDRALVRFGLDGSGRTAVGNAAATITTLFTLKDVIVFGASGRALVSMNKLTGAFLSEINYSYSGTGYSVVPALNRAFFRSTGVSPSDIHYLEIGADGKLVSGKDSPYHGSYPSATRTFVFPNGARVADDSGTVYSTGSLSYMNSLGAAFTDLDFHGVDVPVILRGNKLQAYSNTLLESGSFTLSGTGARLAVAENDALVFIPDGTSLRGMRVQTVPLASFTDVVPGKPIEAGGLPYTPDDVFVDRNGELLLFSKSQLSLFRWSPSLKGYLPTIPLVGAPTFAAYSAATHHAYFAYDSQVIRDLDLNAPTPAEKPLFTLPMTPRGLATAGEFVFAADASGAWDTHYLFSPAGTLIHSLDWNYYSRVWQWDAVKRRMYFFRDDTSPDDLHYETIDTTGKIAGAGETPYHGDFTVTPPIRVSQDGGKVAIGSGVVFETAGLTRITTLPITFTDALWRTSELLTIRTSGTQTQVQRWNGSTLAAAGSLPLFAGTPLRLLALNARDSALITMVDGMPRIYLLNDDLTIGYTYISQPPIPTSAAEDVPFAWTPKFLWQTLGTGPVTLTAPVLPAWLKFENGVLSGTPREADAGDQVTRGRSHHVVFRGMNTSGLSEEKAFDILVAWRNDAPVLPANLPPVLANDRADPSRLDVAPNVVDPDLLDPHRWRITHYTNPALFSSVGISPAGFLEIAYAPYVSGSSDFTLEVRDASDAIATTTVRVILPELPAPAITVSPTITFNRSNGLYEQLVTAKNVAARAIGGFDLTVAGLRSGVSVYNGATLKNGNGVFHYPDPLAAGKSVTVVLRYYAVIRGTIPQPSITGSVFVPGVSAIFAVPAAAVVAPAQPFTISEITRSADGTVAVEFNAVAGESYRLNYSGDSLEWKSCPDVISAPAGGKMIWIDRGPPATATSPADETRRFYRVERLATPDTLALPR